MGLLDFFDLSKKRMSKLEAKADSIIMLEEDIGKLSDKELKNKTLEFKDLLKENKTLDDILPEAYAVVREASYRILGLKAYRVQIMAAIELHNGNISQMKTGEGKTLASLFPAYLNALEEKGVHVVTVNNYLAKRDKEEMGQVYEFLGLSVGLIEREMSNDMKKLAYQSDITYGVNSEFGFDFLRDNLAVTKNMIAQRNLNYVIIDEIDSILIDDAKTPLIISGQGKLPSEFYNIIDKFVKTLKKGKHYIDITDDGIKKVEKVFGFENLYIQENQEFLHHLNQALRANHLFKKDKEYLVSDGEILIIDKYTGRALKGRRFSKGLHQALEAKEKLQVQKESKTLATITYQNYFNKYNKMSGMTGTAVSEEEEFRTIYGMDVVEIPTNRPVIREELEDQIFKTENEKIDNIVSKVKEKYLTGQPILIGAVHIDTSEKISEELKKVGISHTVLNAKQNSEEAEIIALAGQKGAVTIATNMAGRGTDIKITDDVKKLGGLYVIAVEKHEAKRIDKQLIGRCGRQGDPGETQFFISFEDKIFDYLTEEKKEELDIKLNELSITHNYFKEFVEKTQQVVNGINSSIRQRTYEYELIIANHRRVIYGERDKILNSVSMKEYYQATMDYIIEKIIKEFTSEIEYPEDWDLEGIQKTVYSQLGYKSEIDLLNLTEEEVMELNENQLIADVLNEAHVIYAKRENIIGDEKMRYLERLILMKVIDEKWIIYLTEVEELKQELRMHYTAKEPIMRKYNKECNNMFESLKLDIQKTSLKRVLSLLNGLEKEEKQANSLYEKLTEQEKNDHLKKLEEKFEVIRQRLPKISKNQSKLVFKGDINTTEEMEVKINLYYLNDGIEKPLLDHCYKKVIDGPFDVEFNLENDVWKTGWYQVRINVLNEVAQRIDYFISEDKDLNQTKDTEEIDVRKLKFFPNNIDEINFNIKINKPKFEDKEIKAHLLLNTKLIVSTQLKIENKIAKIKFQNKNKKLQNGIYHLILNIDEQIKVPFLVADSHNAKNVTIKLPIRLNTNEEFDLVCDMFNLDTEKTIVKMNVKSVDIPKGGLQFTKKNGWDTGRYMFRIFKDNHIIYNKFIIVE